MLAISIQGITGVPILVLNEGVAVEETEPVEVVVPLAVLGGLGVLAAVGFALTLGFGWILGMAVQGFVLFYCLERYFWGPRPAFIYPVMFFSVLLVLYMNSSGVRGMFRPGRVFR